jgi:hypothetical protein
MILNLAISAAIGIVPIVGDILLASYRANVRNARLLENFLHLRGERVAKGGAHALSEKNNASADGDEGEGQRGAAGGRITEDNGSEKMMMSHAPLSQQGTVAEAARSSDGEKTTLVPDSTEGDDKDKGVATPASVPDNADGENLVPTPRPPRSVLEFLQHRDSRFIEDVT